MKLESYLILNKYFLNLFGVDDFNRLRERLRDTNEGYDSTGRSYFIDSLIGLKPEWESELLKYDEAIREYVERLRRNRKQSGFNLKYFQYLAVLFSEIFLENYFNRREKLLRELNKFLKEFNRKNRTGISEFKEEDLKKIAFWMATGSGKTLIMHINYWQILKYSKNNWDNIILITPNEGLSRQHYEELKQSGIPCKLYDGNLDSLKTKSGEVLVIDIHKLTEEKKGEGVSVDVSFFDGKNLVFIDEGHKGQKSEEQKWKKLRETIGKDGFIFEYSATFGQVIGKNKELLEEYAKAIIFDYSYKYFYTDGYGKDFYVYNIKTETKKDKYSDRQQELLLVAGLLSFYEQLLVFEENREELKELNIEKPLWIFVGSKVTGKGINSDVLRVIKFLDSVIKDEYFLKSIAEQILEGKSGLIDSSGNDIFEGKFEILKELNEKNGIDFLVEDIYKRVFNGRGNLELYDIKNAEGEIGLKVSTAERYFGVINVGDTRTLKKLISQANIEVKEDHFSQSLFFEINRGESSLNLLIGSKKFMEGWNSWRVSNMCLINMGKSEGPQIIQLFGRGVRLKGRNFSLKREENPDYRVKILQTLFVFGLNADYVNAFLEAIEKEEVECREIAIPIKFNIPEKWEGKIYTIKTEESFDFLRIPVKLTVDEEILSRIKIDLRPKITVAHGLKTQKVDSVTDEPVEIPEEYFELLDWNLIYSEVLNYKMTQGMYNLSVNLETLKNVVKAGGYRLFLEGTEGIAVKGNTLELLSFKGVEKLNKIVSAILKSYIKKFYTGEWKREEMKHLKAEPLTTEKHPHMYPKDGKIILKIPEELKKDIEKVMKQLDGYDPQNNKIPAEWKNWSSFIIHFDSHLYTPLVIWRKNKDEITSIPVKLNRGETEFLEDFKSFLKSDRRLCKYDIFLLRNLSKRGIGFFVNSGFYPDFIIWIKDASKQHVIFIDPKGIRNLEEGFENEKIKLCTLHIKEIEKVVNEYLKNKGDRTSLKLDAFIISVTPYREIKPFFNNCEKEEFEKHKVFFLRDFKGKRDGNYLRKIFKSIIERR